MLSDTRAAALSVMRIYGTEQARAREVDNHPL